MIEILVADEDTLLLPANIAAFHYKTWMRLREDYLLITLGSNHFRLMFNQHSCITACLIIIIIVFALCPLLIWFCMPEHRTV